MEDRASRRFYTKGRLGLCLALPAQADTSPQDSRRRVQTTIFSRLFRLWLKIFCPLLRLSFRRFTSTSSAFLRPFCEKICSNLRFLIARGILKLDSKATRIYWISTGKFAIGSIRFLVCLKCSTFSVNFVPKLFLKV